MKERSMKAESLLREAAQLSAERETERLSAELEQSPDARRMADEMFLHGRKKALKAISFARLRSAGARLKLAGGIAASVMVLCLSLLLGFSGYRKEPTSAREPISTLPAVIISTTGGEAKIPAITEFITLVPTKAGDPTAEPFMTPSPTPSAIPATEKPNKQTVPDNWEGKHYFRENPDASEPRISYLANDEIVYAQIMKYDSCSLTEYYGQAMIQPAGAAEYVKIGENKVAMLWQKSDGCCLCWDDSGNTLLLSAGSREIIIQLAESIILIEK